MGWDALHTQLRVDNSTKCLYDSQSLRDFWSCASVEFIVMAPALDAYEIFNPEIIRYFKYIYISPQSSLLIPLWPHGYLVGQTCQACLDI